MSQLCLNRYLIETIAPLAINSGGRESGFDAELARDANGLPVIPATAIAGVWRHLAIDAFGEATTKRWFGSIDKDGEGSRLFIQNGLLLDSRHQLVQGLMTQADIHNDKLLKRLYEARPHHRERVRINDRGVAADKGKFDQLLLPKGVRFCFDVRWQGNADEVAEWQQLEALLASPLFALGAFTRNGLGRFHIIANHTQTLELQQNRKAGEALRHFMQRKVLPSTTTLKAPQTMPFARLSLTAWDSWRCGKGDRPLGKEADSHTDSFTYSEPFISWQNNHATWNADAKQAVLCGSSIKGILAHRVAFHYRRHTEQFAEALADADHATWEKSPDELTALFGDAGNEKEGHSGQAGRLIVEDAIIDNPRTTIRTHNSIDRFTGGVRMGALFSEELLWQPSFQLMLYLMPGTSLSEPLIQALNDTFDDLKQGLLPLGAGSGRGNSLVSHQSGHWEIDLSQLNTATQKEAAA